MKTLIYFKGNFETLTEVRQYYYNLAKLHHPDHGGNTATMQEINNEYEYLTDQVLQGNIYKEWTPAGKKHETEVGADLVNIINEILKYNLPGCIVEICGNWTWISGNTRPVKETLKNLGFKFSAGKLAWYWHPEGYSKKSGKKFDLSQIRNLWGSENVEIKDRNIYIS
jgi:curved DNA-binding protein CbpA